MLKQHVVVLRHAERMDEVVEDWAVKAARPWDPPLSPKGQLQAQAVALRLKQLDFPITKIYCSPFVRCLQTALFVRPVLEIEKIHVCWDLSEALFRIKNAPEGPVSLWPWHPHDQQQQQQDSDKAAGTEAGAPLQRSTSEPLANELSSTAAAAVAAAAVRAACADGMDSSGAAGAAAVSVRGLREQASDPTSTNSNTNGGRGGGAREGGGVGRGDCPASSVEGRGTRAGSAPVCFGEVLGRSADLLGLVMPAGAATDAEMDGRRGSEAAAAAGAEGSPSVSAEEASSGGREAAGLRKTWSVGTVPAGARGGEQGSREVTEEEDRPLTSRRMPLRGSSSHPSDEKEMLRHRRQEQRQGQLEQTWEGGMDLGAGPGTVDPGQGEEQENEGDADVAAQSRVAQDCKGGGSSGRTTAPPRTAAGTASGTPQPDPPVQAAPQQQLGGSSRQELLDAMRSAAATASAAAATATAAAAAARHLGPISPETIEQAYTRYARCIEALACQSPSDNILCITHGDAVGRATALFCPGATVFEVSHTGFVIGSRTRITGEEETAAAAAEVATEASADEGTAEPTETARLEGAVAALEGTKLTAESEARADPTNPALVAVPSDPGIRSLTGSPRIPPPAKPAQWLPWQCQGHEECAGQGVHWMVLDDD